MFIVNLHDSFIITSLAIDGRFGCAHLGTDRAARARRTCGLGPAAGEPAARSAAAGAARGARAPHAVPPALPYVQRRAPPRSTAICGCMRASI